ncbi:hypothetical protein ACFFQF_05145 [Haladaptatus pallidirubidus]|uniref:Uncharacterized protein n=1 Tax=Haladaptatus pallidirubidus TaxID=1008152 RepID=A0AAV3ULG2_9EURY|nr:hypothetical protein [Haladaptatus pallidirubidus]
MQKQEINTGCTDAPNGVTPRPTDDTAVIGGGSAELSEGEEHRITHLLSWKPTPTDFLTVGGNEIQDAVPEEAKEGV